MAVKTLKGLSIVSDRKTLTGLSTVKPLRVCQPSRPDLRVVAIEGTRRRIGMSTSEMVRRAGIDRSSWEDLRRGAKPRESTLRRLHKALAGYERVNPAGSLVWAVMALLARELGDDIETLRAQDFTAERPMNPLWLRAATVRRYAMTIVAIDLDFGNPAVARACGCSRQAVKIARDQTEDARERDAKLDAVLDYVTTLVSDRVGFVWRKTALVNGHADPA